MKFLSLIALAVISASDLVRGDAATIVATARSVMGTPYSWGGGGWAGKSLGNTSGAHIVGFDCSGLAQYSVYKGTGKKIQRVSRDQFVDRQCKHVPVAEHLPGDLVFYEADRRIYHVAVVSGHNTMIHAPQPGDHVRESPFYTKGLVSQVQRCW